MYPRMLGQKSALREVLYGPAGSGKAVLLQRALREIPSAKRPRMLEVRTQPNREGAGNPGETFD